MSVNVIDTIKPKNGGSFPVVEAVDVSVSGGARLDTALAAKANASDLASKASQSELNALATQVQGKANASDISDIRTTLALKANQSSLDATNVVVATKAAQSSLDALSVVIANKADKKDYTEIYTALDSKASKAELNTEVTAINAEMASLNNAITQGDADLQNQIDQIEISASSEAVVAPEVAAARVGADGTSYDTLKNRIDSEVNDLAKSIGDTKNATYPLISGERFVPSKFEQGRYKIDSETSEVSKNDDDSPEIKAIRIRTDIFELDSSVRIEVEAGYKAEIYRLNNSNIQITHINWTNTYIIQGGCKCAIVVKKDDGTAIDYNIGNKIVYFRRYSEAQKVKALAVWDNKNVEYSYGSITTGNYRAAISKNNTAAASYIRVRSELIDIKGAVELQVDEGYSAALVYANSTGGYMGSLSSADNRYTSSTGYSFYLSARKSDDSEITIDEAIEHIRVKTRPYNTFAFTEGGISTDGDGYYYENLIAEAIDIRIHTLPQLMDKPFCIKAKEGYSFTFTLYSKDEHGYKLIKTETHSQSIWLNKIAYSASDDVYYAIAIKKNDGGSLYPVYLDNYVDIEYDYAQEVGTAPERFKAYNVLLIGDSITEINFTASINWTRHVTSWCGFGAVNNTARGGCGIVAGGANAWNNKIDDIEGDYDLILIMGNMNDYSNNIFDRTSLGEYGDTTLATEYGALYVFLNKVINKFPLAKIGWITSTPRQYYAGDGDNPSPVTEEGYLYGLGGVFEGAVQAIKDTCADYSIPVLDLYHESGFNPRKTEQKAAWMYNDGNYVHPNDEGHLIMAYKIYDFIQREF